MQEICRIGQYFFTHFICLHKISPYPLSDMCKKCEEMSCFGSLEHVGSLSFCLLIYFNAFLDQFPYIHVAPPKAMTEVMTVKDPP